MFNGTSFQLLTKPVGKVADPLVTNKVTNNYLQQILKSNLESIAYLQNNNEDVLKVLNENKETFKHLFVALDKLESKKSEVIPKDIQASIKDIQASNDSIASSFNNMEAVADRSYSLQSNLSINSDRMLSLLTSISDDIELGNSRNEKITDLLRLLSLKQGVSPDVVKGGGSTGGSFLDLAKNLMNPKALLATIGTGAGGILGSIAGALGLKKLVGFIRRPKVIKTPVGKLGKAVPNLSFVGREAKVASELGTVGKLAKSSKTLKILSAVGKPLKFLGKVAGKLLLPLNAIMTAYDLYNNVQEEFFGADKGKTSVGEKIRNVITKTISDFFFNLIDYKTLNSAIDSVTGMVTGVGSKIATSIGGIIGAITNGLKSVLPEWASKWLPDMGGGGTNTQTSNNQTSNAPPPVYGPPKPTMTDKIYDKAKTYFTTPNPNANSKEWSKAKQGEFSTQRTIENNKAMVVDAPSNLGNVLANQAIKDFGNITKPGYKCYTGVWNTLQKVGFDKSQGVNPTGDQRDAYQFADWAKKSRNMVRIVPGLDANGSLTNIQPGDIVVYGSGKSNSRGKSGHIEIFAKNAKGADMAISDFNDKGASQIKQSIRDGRMMNGDVTVWRMKNATKLIPRPHQVKQKIDEKKGGGSGKSSVKVPTATITQKTNTPVAKVTGANQTIKDQVFKGLAKNEISTPDEAYTISHAMKNESNFSVGKSQFDIGKRSDVWAKLGYTPEEIKKLQSLGTQARASGGVKNLSKGDQSFLTQMKGRLKGKKGLINQLDSQENDSLYNQYQTDKKGLFRDLDVSDPRVMGQMIDIYNQYGKGVFDSQTVEKLKRFSGGSKITVGAMKKWRLANTSMSADDQTRRFNNINSSIDLDKVASNPTPVADVSKKIVEKAVNKSKQPTTQVAVVPTKQVVSTPPVVSTNPPPTMRRTGIGDENLIFINLGLFG